MLKLILKNTGSNIIVFITKLVITFIMTPIFVRNLGNYDYGIWEVIGSVLGYMGILDIGILSTSARYAAYFRAKNDRESLIKVYSTSFLFMLIASLFLFSCLVMCALWKPEMLAQGQPDTTKYAFVIIIIAFQILFVFPGGIAESFLEGFQKYHLKNRITIVNSILGSILIYHLIDTTNALFILALINACGLSIKVCIFIYLLSKPSHGNILFSFKAANKKTLVELLHFGVKSFIQGSAMTITNASNKIILAYILNPAVVIFYSIPANLTGRILTIRMLLTHTFMPLFSQFHAENKKEAMLKWFLHGSKLITGIMLLIIFGIFFLGNDFIRLWIGKNYAEEGEMVLYTFCVINIFIAINPLYNRYLTGIGKHGYLAKVNIISAIIDIILSIFLTYKIGIMGVVLGTLFPSFFASILILNYTCRSIGISTFQYLKITVLTLLVPLIAFSGVTVFLKYKYPIDSYMKLVVISIIGACVYIMSSLFSLQKTERKFLYDRLPFKRINSNDGK